MSIGTAIMSLLLAMLIAGVSGQPQTVSGSASVSVSASSLQDLQNQIQSEAEKAFSSLDSSASNLNAAVQQLTQVVAQAVAGVLVNLLESGSVNATAAGIEISGAVGGALSAAASSAGGELANLDVDSISADISKSVESTINGATASTSSAELTQEVAQQVLNTLGEGLAEVTGGQFSAQVSVTSVATAAPIALNLVNVDVSGAARLILELMANGSYADAVSQMSKVLLDGGTDQIKEVLTTSVDQGLNQSFIQVMTRIYQNSSFPILPFSVSLGTAFGEVENQGAFVDLLGQVFTIVNQSGDYPNLREALYYAFTSQGGNIRAAYDQSLSSAIEESGCSSVAQVLAAGKDRADQLGLGTLFMIAIQNNPDINECLQVGVELQVSIDILGQLADTQRAVELILDAISKGQIITISNLIIQAIQEGQFTELQQVLTQVFCDEGIQQDQLVEAISATVADGENQGLTNVTNVLGQILADASCNNQVETLVDFGLSDGGENSTDAFVKIIKDSIEVDGCVLLPVMDSLVNNASINGDQSIIDLINSDVQLQGCVSQDVLTKIAPIPSPSPPSPPQPSPPPPPTTSPSPPPPPPSPVVLAASSPPPSPVVLAPLPAPEPEPIDSIDEPSPSPSPSPSAILTPTPTPIPDIFEIIIPEPVAPVPFVIPTVTKVVYVEDSLGIAPAREVEVEVELPKCSDSLDLEEGTECYIPPPIPSPIPAPTLIPMLAPVFVPPVPESQFSAVLSSSFSPPSPNPPSPSPPSPSPPPPMLPPPSPNPPSPPPPSPSPPSPSPPSPSPPSPPPPSPSVCGSIKLDLLVELSNGKTYSYGYAKMYEDAKIACECLNSSLVTMGSSYEEQLVSAAHELKRTEIELLGIGKPQQKYWMGVNNPSGKKSLDAWVENDGDDVSYVNWKWDQPTYITNEIYDEECAEVEAKYQDCEGVKIKSYSAWQDNICSDRISFICEGEVAPRLNEAPQEVEFLYVAPLRKSYVFLKDKQYSWSSAKQACEFMGAQMITYSDRVEEDLVMGAIASVLPDYAAEPIWIGLQRDGPECNCGCSCAGEVGCGCGGVSGGCGCMKDLGDFYWVGGRPLGDYQNWLGTPCGMGNAQCLPEGQCVFTYVQKTPYTISAQWRPYPDCGFMAYGLCEMQASYT